jgi:integrase
MRGWLSHTVAVPKLSTQGMKSTPRPAFNKKEIDRMLAYMVEWETQGRFSVEHEIRPLLRDYIELLLYTGMRHGTEALNIKWKDVQWYSDDDIRYLRIWVSGKTGGRWLIAKHKAIDALKRLHQRQKAVRDLDFEDLLVSNKSNLIFTTSDGYQPRRLDGTFKRLMRDMNMMRGEEGQNRTLYSIRHTYATFELLEGNVDIHTLSKQMGNSAAMIEKHYSKLTPTLAAKKLA